MSFYKKNSVFGTNRDPWRGAQSGTLTFFWNQLLTGQHLANSGWGQLTKTPCKIDVSNIWRSLLICFPGLEDLDSDAGTDDEDCPRKQVKRWIFLIWNSYKNNWCGHQSLIKLNTNIIQVPKWAEGTNLRTALLKQCYMPPDLDQIFATVEMPDLSSMFVEQRKRFLLLFTFFKIVSLPQFTFLKIVSLSVIHVVSRFFKRTSSACWEQPPESFKHGPRRAWFWDCSFLPLTICSI